MSPANKEGFSFNMETIFQNDGDILKELRFSREIFLSFLDEYKLYTCTVQKDIQENRKDAMLMSSVLIFIPQLFLVSAGVFHFSGFVKLGICKLSELKWHKKKK